MRHRRLSPDHEERQRQLPPEQHPGRDEAHQSQRRQSHHLRTHSRRRLNLLRQQSRQQSRPIQATIPSHPSQPLRPKPQRRKTKGLHPRPLPKRLMAVNQLKAGALLNYVTLGLNAITALLYTPYMLRMLGQSEYGIYSLAASVISYLSMLDLGLGNAVIRYTAKLRAEDKKEEQYELFGMFTKLYIMIGILTIILGSVLFLFLDSMFGSTLSEIELNRTKIIVILMIINLAFSFPLSIYGAIITAYENFVFLRIIQIARILLNLIVMIALLYIGYKAVAMVVVQTVFNFLTLGINYFYCKNKIEIKIKFVPINWNLFKEITIYSFWIFLNVIMDRIYWSTGQFILGATSGAIAIAVFSVALHIEGIYITFSTAISGVFLPRVTKMVTKDNNELEISNLFIKTGRIQYCILAFILSGFIVFGQDFIQARNQLKFRSILYVSIAFVSLFFQIPIAKFFGSLGCALVISVALIIGHVFIMNIYYHKYQGINIKQFWIEISKMSIVPFCFSVLGLFFIKYFPITSLSELLLGVALYSIIYIPMFWRFSMNNYERSLILSPIKSVLHR